MQSHEVMREVLKKTSAKQIAADMGLSLSLIYKWAEPPEDDSGSGAYAPPNEPSLDAISSVVDDGSAEGLAAVRRAAHANQQAVIYA